MEKKITPEQKNIKNNEAVTFVAELAKEDGDVKIVHQEGRDYFIAEVRANGEVIYTKLIPIETAGIRDILTALGEYHTKMAKKTFTASMTAYMPKYDTK